MHIPHLAHSYPIIEALYNEHLQRIFNDCYVYLFVFDTYRRYEYYSIDITLRLYLINELVGCTEQNLTANFRTE